MLLFLFLFVLNLFKIFAATRLPLIGDEAYYWLWSKHLAFNYVDHPPLIAYINRLITFFFGNSELAVRLAAIIIILIITWFIYLTGKELFDERAGALAAIVFNLIPTFFGGGMFLVPQTLLFLFWTISFYLLAKIFRSPYPKPHTPYLWLLLGLTAGLGFLSDYIMGLFFVGVFIFLLTGKDRRTWLTRFEPYLGLLIALIIITPALTWQFSHNFISFKYQGARASSSIFHNLAESALLQIVFFTPTIFGATVYYLISIFRRKKQDLLSFFSNLVFIPFALLSALTVLGVHWPSTAYLPSIVSSKQHKRSWLAATIVFALIINALGFAYFLFLYPVPKNMAGHEYEINRRLPQYLADQKFRRGQKFILANNLGLAALVAFHGNAKTNMPPGRHPQYDLWGKPAIKAGDNIIYFVLDDAALMNRLKPVFKLVTVDEGLRVFTKDSDIPTKTKVLICEGYKGGVLP